MFMEKVCLLECIWMQKKLLLSSARCGNWIQQKKNYDETKDKMVNKKIVKSNENK